MKDYTGLNIDASDPLIADWALTVIERLKHGDPEAAKVFTAHVFDEGSVRSLMEQAEETVLSALFRVLPAKYFSSCIDLVVEKWEQFEGPHIAHSSTVTAMLMPEKAAGLFSEFVDSEDSHQDTYKLRGVFEAALLVPGDQGEHIRERLLELYYGLDNRLLLQSFFNEALALAYERGEEEVFRLLERLPQIVGPEGNLDSFSSTIYRKMTGGLPYFGLAIDIIDCYTDQSFSSLPRLFSEDAPLRELDRLCLQGDVNLMYAAVELLPPRKEHRGPDPVELSHMFLETADKYQHKENGQSICALIIGLVAGEYARTRPDWSGCEVEELVEYAGADLQSLPGQKELTERLRELDHEEVVGEIIDVYPFLSGELGAERMSEIMGELAFPEFVFFLLDTLKDGGYRLCELAMYALGKIGEEAEKEICEKWKSLGPNQQIYALGALEHCGGERTVELLIDIFPGRSGYDLEAWETTSFFVPDMRLIKLIEPELKRNEHTLDEAFLVFSSLLNYEHPDIPEIRKRWEEKEAQTSERMEAILSGHIEKLVDASLEMELLCPLCRGKNIYNVHRVFLGVDCEDKSPFIGEELRCLSCGKIAELAPTERGEMAVTAETLKYRVLIEKGGYYDGPLKFADARLADGRIVSLKEGIEHYKERLKKDPKSVVDLISLANCCEKAERPTMARECFEKAFKIDSNYVEAALGLSYLLEKEGDDRGAFIVLDKALKNKKNWKFCRLLNVTENEYYAAFAEQYNDLLDFMRLPNKKPLSPDFMTRFSPDKKKIGRNEPCPCGSGKKYKKCCLGKENR